MSSIFVILKFKRAYLKFSVSGRSKQANIHTHVRNEVTLVWGTLRLAAINYTGYYYILTSVMLGIVGASLSKQM